MTSIHIYDPVTGASLPDLPPLPMDALVVGAKNLLQEAADLPAARATSPSPTPSTSAAVRPGPVQPAGRHPVGAAVRRRRHQRAAPGRGRPGDLVPHRVRLLRRVRPGLRPHPGRSGQHLTQQCRAWGTAIPRPGQPERSPTSRKAKELRHAQRYQRHARTPSSPGLAARPYRPARTLRAVRCPDGVPVPGQGRALPQGLRRNLDHRPRPRRHLISPG